MDSASYLAHVRRESSAFEACLAGDLSAPVEHCGDWTLYDLADHLGRDNMWAAAAVTDQRGDYEAPAAPRARDALTTWFRGTCGVLLAALDTDPSAAAWTLAPPPTVGFWQRRRALETLIHRWDAERALGMPSPLDPALAADGVAEVVGTMAPRQVRLGRTTALRHAIRLRAGDTGGSWILGPGEPVATISATAADLLLLLWGRLPPMTRRSPGPVTGRRPGPRSAGSCSVNRPPRTGMDVIAERILATYDTITVVGASAAPAKAAHYVPAYMQRHGWRIIPVNPHADAILGEPVYRLLADVPGQIGLVNVFRPSGQTPEIARQAVAAGATALWLQLGIASAEARAVAEEAGLLYVEDRCLIIEQRRLQLDAPGSR